MRRGALLAHLFINGAADNIAGRPLASRIIIKHKPLFVTIHQMTASPTKPFFKHRAGHFCAGTSQQACRVKLHHFHIAQRQTAAHGHRQPIHGFVTGWRMIFIHGRAATGCHQHCFSAHQAKLTGPHINKKNPSQRRPIT